MTVWPQVKDVHDKRFDQTFEQVFTSSHLQSDNHFRVLAGNHDHYGMSACLPIFCSLFASSSMLPPIIWVCLFVCLFVWM